MTLFAQDQRVHYYYEKVGAVLLFLQLLLLPYKVFRIAFIGHFQSAWLYLQFKVSFQHSGQVELCYTCKQVTGCQNRIAANLCV